MGVVLMLPSSLYERIVSKSQGPTDITQMVQSLLLNSERHAQRPRQLITWRLVLGTLLFAVIYSVFAVLFIISAAEAASEDFFKFWGAVGWTGWGLLAGSMTN